MTLSNEVGASHSDAPEKSKSVVHPPETFLKTGQFPVDPNASAPSATPPSPPSPPSPPHGDELTVPATATQDVDDDARSLRVPSSCTSSRSSPDPAPNAGASTTSESTPVAASPPALHLSEPPETGTVASSAEAAITEGVPLVVLADAAPLNPNSFPNPPQERNSSVQTTIPNVRHLLNAYGITARYNVIRKFVEINVPRVTGTPDNAVNVALNQILSLAVLNRMSTGLIPGFVEAIADENSWNPVAAWISSRAWDGVDRLPAICRTLTVREGFDESFKNTILQRWLLSCVAAAYTPSGFTCRGVLTIQGAQGLGKTRWIASLVPVPLLRDEVVRLGHHLDARNKDDVISAISHWIVEIGELDSSLRKDVAALKGFLTNDRDKIRRPYSRADSEYPRKTVFAATVNDSSFLVDATGNTRFWTLPVVKIDHGHDVDMQQLFAQLLVDFREGATWWLTDDEQARLESFNREHRAVNAIRELIAGQLDWPRAYEKDLPALTATEVLQHLGYKQPSNAQCKECNAALRELLGEPRRIRGNNRWRVPWIGEPHSDLTSVHRRVVHGDDEF